MLPPLIFRATIAWLREVTDAALETLAGQIAELRASVSQNALVTAEQMAAFDARLAAVEARLDKPVPDVPDETKPDPDPKPDPKPDATPTLTVDGQAFTTTLAATLALRSGRWQMFKAGEVAADTNGYVWTLDGALAYAMLDRRTAEESEGPALVTRTHQVTATLGTAQISRTVTTVQGSLRVLFDKPPVQPNPDWLREAVKAGKVPLYPRTSSWGKVLPALSVPKWATPGYDPASLGVGDSGKAPTGASNFIGRTDSSGGEHEASRGYLHNTDARFIAAAVEGDDAGIAACFGWLAAQTYYAAAMPQGGVWSASLNGLVDPQIPQAGERAWSRGLGKAQNRPAIALMADATGWGRNTAHLENVGYAHWLLTEDPVAGLVVQRQLQFALAECYAYVRPAAGLSAYRPCAAAVDEPRAAYNNLSALQKASVVAEAIGKADCVLWGADRLAKMAADVWDWFDRNRITPLETAATPDFAARRASGLDLMSPNDTAAPYDKTFADGTVVYFRTASDFQQPQYGKEPLYLWTMAGYRAAARALRHDASGAINRLLHLGGAMGAGEMPSSTGSGIFYGPFSADGKQFLGSDGKAWAEWAAATFPGPSRVTMDGAYMHTAEQLRGTLVYARAAINAGKLVEDAVVNRQAIDAALQAYDAAAKATTKWQVQPLWCKHLGQPAA